jgi:outer membrane protein assembly factor BamB
VVDGERLFLTSGYDVGSALLRIKEQGGKWSVEEIWKKPTLRCRYSSPVLHGGYVYGLDEGVLACVSLENGERQWRRGRYGNGQLLLANGLLMVLTERTGELVLIEPSPKGLNELGHHQVLEPVIAWNVPALSGGLLLVRNAEEMACCGPGTDTAFPEFLK